MMNETETLDPALKPLLDQMVTARQLSSADAATLTRQRQAGKVLVQTQDDILRWLAKEYDVAYATLDKYRAGPGVALTVPGPGFC